MTTSLNTIILAGGLRPAPLREALGLPVLCLPIRPQRSLLALWLEQLGRADSAAVHIVVSDGEDAEALRAHLDDVDEPALPGTDVMIEPARWRGTGGLLRDAAVHLGMPDRLLLVEAGSMTPDELDPLVRPIEAGEPMTVGIDERARPAGVYAFRAEAVREIPAEGYVDLKEQVLPAFHESGRGARAVRISREAQRVRDRAGYLEVVRAHADGRADGAASVAEGAVLAGHVLLGRDAVVEDRAIVHDSVILDGAVIRRGAVVSRSIVGVGREIAGGRVLREAVEASAARESAGVRQRSRRPLSPASVQVGREACSHDA